MSDADKPAPGEHADGGEIVSRYEVVPYAEKTDDADLYSFRASMPAPAPAVPAPTPAQQAAAGRKKILLIAGVAGLGLLFIALIAVIASNQQESAVPFIDLGANNVASAGLAGRLIVKWDGKSEYELHIDPLVPRQIPGFSAVASNPPHPISIDLRLKDVSGSVLCQKEILLPLDPAAQADPAQAQPLVPTQTVGGDIVQNVAGTDGQIGEMVINGQIPCPVKSYKRLASWDFASSFPTLAEQEDWMRHEQGVEAELQRKAAEARARAFIPHVRPLPAPIDGDDVIVFDNPSKGMVETRAGRVFFVGRDGLRGRAPGWQIFPATIHFHCDVKANCVLTRADATTSLQARFVH
jgi:hypothetical protein